MNGPVLEISNVSVSFDGVAALRRFSCTLGPSEILGLIGPNGAGKTTLFNVVTGFLPAETGAVRLHGRELLGAPPYRIARNGVARTFQDLRLIRQIPAIENVLLALRGQPGEALLEVFFYRKTWTAREQSNRQRAVGLLAEAGLASKADVSPGALSYGQQKLLSLVCCLGSGAEVLLLDEPIAGVAPEMSERLIEVLRRSREERRSMIVVEHNLAAIWDLCDRVVFIDAGQKVTEGTPDQVRNDPRVVESYLR